MICTPVNRRSGERNGVSNSALLMEIDGRVTEACFRPRWPGYVARGEPEDYGDAAFWATPMPRWDGTFKNEYYFPAIRPGGRTSLPMRLVNSSPNVARASSPALSRRATTSGWSADTSVISPTSFLRSYNACLVFNCLYAAGTPSRPPGLPSRLRYWCGNTSLNCESRTARS